MNIIYIHTHDTGRYISPYGYKLPTPILENFAKESALFRHAYCAGPTCSPSRAALLTGTYPHQCQMLGLTHRGFSIADENMHLAAYLKKNGFETVLSGVQHELTNQQVNLVYDKILHNDSYKDKLKNEYKFDISDYSSAWQAADYLNHVKSDKPFFLSVGFVNTHRDFPPISQDIDSNYLRPPSTMPDLKQNRDDMACYATAAKTVDNCVGIVLDAIKNAGLESNTVILFTTDHGIAYPNMKCSLYDDGIGVALIIKYPHMKSSGKAFDSLISHIDIYPTLCELIGIAPPEWLSGLSFLEILEEKRNDIRDEVFAQVTYHAAYQPMRCVRTSRYKYIVNYEPTNTIAANIDDGIAKSFMIQAGILNESIEREQLFDLWLDPCERVNLVSCSRYANQLSLLRSRLATWQESTNDPLLTSSNVPLPKGAWANVSTASSAKEQNFVYGELDG